MWLASLWYLLYCSGLELNPRHLGGISAFPEPVYAQSPPLSTSLMRAVQLLQRVHLHWHVIIPQSPQFTSGFTLAVHSVDLDRCIITWGWDGLVASPTGWTWVWVSSGSWWWTRKPGVLQSVESRSRTRLSDWTDWWLECHSEYFHCLKNPAGFTYSSLPPNPRQPLILPIGLLSSLNNVHW